MKKKTVAFSLMEMMIVLLIIAIIIAASAPMVNKKMLSSMAERSPWIWTNLNGAIAYNINGSGEQTAVIGTMTRPAGITSRLHIQGGDVSQITLSGRSNRIGRIFYDFSPGSILFGNENTTTSGEDSIAIGNSSAAVNDHSISIGRNSSARADDSIAIGNQASNT